MRNTYQCRYPGGRLTIQTDVSLEFARQIVKKDIEAGYATIAHIHKNHGPILETWVAKAVKVKNVRK